MSNQETISEYLAGDLDLLRKGEMERRLKEDDAFAIELQEARERILMARAVERAALKASLKESLAGRKSTSGIARPLYAAGAMLAVAAAVLLLVFLGPVSQKPDMQKMALAYLEPYPLPAQRGEDQLKALRAKAYGEYRQGDFEKAEKSFEALRENDFSVAIFYADCLSQNGKYTEAIEVLRHLTQGSPRADAAEWRLALNLTLKGEKEEANAILTRIANSNHYKAKEAKKLLQAQK